LDSQNVDYVVSFWLGELIDDASNPGIFGTTSFMQRLAVLFAKRGHIPQDDR